MFWSMLPLTKVPFYPLLGDGSPTKLDYGKKGTLILTSLLEDVGNSPLGFREPSFWNGFGQSRVCLRLGESQIGVSL